jgi:hypothetical protein
MGSHGGDRLAVPEFLEHSFEFALLSVGELAQDPGVSTADRSLGALEQGAALAGQVGR